MLGLVVGVLVGWWMSTMGDAAKASWDEAMVVVRDVFLHLIKVMIAPLIFASVVQGFAGTGDIKRAQRIGWKSLPVFRDRHHAGAGGGPAGGEPREAW